MKQNPFIRLLSLALVLALLIQIVPPEVFALEESTASTAVEVPVGQPSYEVLWEETSLRSEDTKHFRLTDGSFIAVNYGMAVHYQDEDGTWQDIDNTPVMAMSLEESDLQMVNGESALSFASNLEDGSLITVSRDGVGVSMSLLDTAQARALTGEPSTYAARGMTYSRTAAAELSAQDTPITAGNGRWDMEDILPPKLRSTVVYEDAYPGVDLRYTAWGYNVKEEIIVKEPQASYRYDFRLDLTGLTAELNGDGSISLRNTQQQTVYTIPAPFMVDAAGAVSYDVTYTLTEYEGDAVLTVIADEGWMEQEDRVYPVSIDPSLEVSSGKYQEDIYSVYTMEEAPNTATFGYRNLYCGSSDTGNRYRVYMHINELPELPKNATMTDVSLNLYLNQFGHRNMEDLPLGLYRVSDEKPSQYATYRDWFAALCWNNQPSFDTDTLLDYATASYSAIGSCISLELTALARQWYKQADPNTTLALAATNPDAHTENSFAYASLLAYGNVYPPTLFVAYRNTYGIEPYYTYTTLGAGSAGAGYISDATGQLKAVKNILSFASGVNPFSMSLVYNSDYCVTADAPWQAAEKLGLSMKLGGGWNLDCVQKVEPEIIDETTYLKYTDGDGTIHYFARNLAMDSTGVYYFDEDGLGLKIKSTGYQDYQMSDDKDNLWNFTNFYLTSTQDPDGNQILFVYENKQLKTVKQKNNGGSEITVATLVYNSSNTLKFITDYSNTTYELIYTGSNLTAIKRGGDTIALYGYDGCLMTRMTDVESGYALAFTYTNGKVTRYQEESGNTAGSVVGITYDEGIRTVHRYFGADRVENNGDDTLTYYLFDYAGRTANAYTTDANGKLLGADSAVYSGTGSTDKTNNRTLRSASIGMAAQHWMRYNSAETDNWTLNNMDYSSATARTGSRSLKGTGSGSGTVSAVNASAALTAGQTYTFSGYVNTSELVSGNTGSILLRVVQGDNIWESEKVNYATLTSVDGGWMRLSVTFTAKASISHSLQVIGSNVNGTFYADDFQLEKGEAPSSYNLVENGDMEMGTEGWTLVNGTSFTTAAGANGSSTSVKIVGNPADDQTHAYQDIPVNLPGTQSYVLSGWFKGDAVPDTENRNDDPANDKYKQCGLRAELTYDDDTKEYHYVSFNTDLEDWQFASLAVVPKEPTKTVKSVRIYCAYERNANTGYFDSISLVREAAQTMKYDDDGNLVSVNTTGKNADQNTYNDGNLIETVTGGNGTYKYTYDTIYKHRLVSATDNHVTQTMTYDSMGNLTSTALSDADDTSAAQMKTYAYYSNDGNRMVRSTDASGATTWYDYDSDWSVMTGNPTSVRNADGIKSVTTYDRWNRVTKTTVENPSATVDEIARLEYDYTNSYLTSVTRTDNRNSVSQSYNFTHDAFGNVTKMSVGEKPLMAYNYAAKNGGMTKQLYANGDSVTYEYDNLGRTVKTTYSDGRVVTVTYAGDGGLHSIHDSVTGVTTVYVRDSLGRLISARGTGENATQYSYDLNNRLSRWVYTIPSLSRTAMHYTYNTTTTDTIPDGLLTGVKMFDGNSIAYEYDFLQRRSRTTIADKLKETYAYAPGAEENTTTTRVSTKRNFWNGTLINQFQHGYDAFGNVTSIYDAVSKQRVNYTYDDLGQLRTATHYTDGVKTHTETYDYDNAGNLLSFSNGTADGLRSISHNYTYGDENWKDLLTAVDGHPFSYDSAGNPTRYYNGAEYRMTWVEGRRLETVTVGGSTYTYQYNADGQRTKKINPDGSYIEYYVVNGVTVGESHFTSGGSKTRGIRYTFDENNTVVGITTGGENYYFAKNLQGDVLAVYQESNNAVVAQYTYDSWGNVVHATGSLAQINPFRYRGYYCDEETDFYYLQSRYYDPAIGRFLNPDQYSDTGDGVLGFNMFAYCLNNPVNRTDDGGCFSLSNLAKLAIGCVATVAAVGITLATGGAALPVLIGVATSTVSGAAVGAVKHRISTGSREGAGKAAIDGAADGFMMGGLSALGGSVIGGVTRTIKNAKSGITIGKMGTFEDVAQLAKTRRYTGLKEYKFIKKIFGDKVATAVGWWQNKSVVKGVMALKGAIYDCGGELTGAYAKEVALTKGYEYLYNIWVM